MTEVLQHLSDRVDHYEGKDPSLFTYSALILLDEFRFGDAASLSEYAQIAAMRRNRDDDPQSARLYWNVAAKLLSRAGRRPDAENARIESAQTWVREAEKADAAGNHAVAQSHFENAIQAYRIIPSRKHLLPALHRKLDAAGAAALKLMQPVSSGPIDIEPLVQSAQGRVRGLSMSNAVYALADITSLMNPDDLRAQVLELAKQHPLGSMFSSVIYDRDGRVIHKTPSLFTDDPAELEQAIEGRVSRHADLLRHLSVSAEIWPALMALLGEHAVEEADVITLIEGSAFIPNGREKLFAMGLTAGFHRDMVTAMHILVPQLEHALRVVLREAGTITASINQDGIQSEWPLGRLLSRDVIGHILPDSLTFELRNILIFRGGSNIRNRLCHGLINSNEFGTANFIYTWWLLLRLSLMGTPGLQAWENELVAPNASQAIDDHRPL